jgi:hypothetical protein
MRRAIGWLLLGFGAFALVTAAMLKFYAYPKLAVVPLDQDSVTTSFGKGMTYFDVGTRKQVTGDLTSTIRVVGNVASAQSHGHDVAVWDKSTVTTTDNGATMVSAAKMRAAFDRASGEAVNCCGENKDGTPVKYDGLVFKFPFNTQKHTYKWWDEDLQEARPMTYEGTEKIDGATTYRFEGTIKPTSIATLKVPSGVVGQTPGSMVEVQEYYSTHRTYWVEPETGALIKAVEEPYTTLRVGGVDKVIATAGTTGFDDKTIKDFADEYKADAAKLRIVRLTGPLVLMVLAVLALLVGTVVTVRRREVPETGDVLDRAPEHSGSV